MSDADRFEVELKFPLGDLRAVVVEQLRTLGAQCGETVPQADRYFNHPQRDFASTDEALRIRSIGDLNVVTYKGPKIDSRTKTRREIELPLGPTAQTAEQLAEVLTVLSFRPVATVRKQRQQWHLTSGEWHFEIALDDVEQVGSYLEIELVATTAQLPAAQAAVLELASRLGLPAQEKRSYLRMLLEQTIGSGATRQAQEALGS